MTSQSKSHLWTDVRDAIAGKAHDYTSGRLSRAIFLLAIPMVLEMFMQSIFAVADAFFVAKLGPAAVATIGISESIVVIFLAVSMGLGMGTTAMIARRIGEKDSKGAAIIGLQAVYLGLLSSVGILFIGIFFGGDLLRLMGASQDVLDIGTGFATHIIAGSGTITMLFIINGAFRGAGNPALALRALAIANLLNVALDPILIFGWGPVPAMGVTGAAIATNIARSIGVLYQFSVLFGGKGTLRMRSISLGIDPKPMIRLIKISGVGIFQFLVAMTSYTGLIRVMAQFPSEATAGFTIAIRVILFILLPAWGMSNAAATLVGQNLGAGRPDRAEEAAWTTAKYNFRFLAVVSVIFFIGAPTIMRLFTNDAAVINYGVQCLRWVSWIYVFVAYGMVMIQSFNGAGDTTTPTYINLASHWGLKIPLAWILSVNMGMGPTGVFVAIPVAELTSALIGIYLFKKGNWKRTKV
ncbi:MATE family efflux transporter [Verrucomicrobia bacterium]|nr:MATE family efflux transporter [Verrucomicrobiota bacterium]